MSKSLLVIALTAALSQVAFGQPGYVGNSSSGTGLGAFGAGEPFYPYDAYEPWVHGHFQRIPAYGGYHYFKPYNYRHVMPQSQVGAGWGMPATMPYSQGFFRAREQQYGATSAPYYRAERPYYSRYAPAPGVIPAGNNGEVPVDADYGAYQR